jgi:hypothetical protein
MGGEGGGGIFWKTPDTALYSIYVSTLSESESEDKLQYVEINLRLR